MRGLHSVLRIACWVRYGKGRRMEASSFWEKLETAASQPDEGGLGLWAWLREKVDPALYRPTAVPDVLVSRLTGREGEYYVLKNPATRTYCQLSERDHFLWVRMDGTSTVKDLVVAYFLEYGSFAFARVAGLVEGLKAGLFLTERPANVYQQVHSRLEARRPGHWLTQVFQAFLQKQFAFSWLDRFVGCAYRWGGRLLFTWPVQILFLGVSAAGLYAFARSISAGQYGLVTIAGSRGILPKKGTFSSAAAFSPPPDLKRFISGAPNGGSG